MYLKHYPVLPMAQVHPLPSTLQSSPFPYILNQYSNPAINRLHPIINPCIIRSLPSRLISSPLSPLSLPNHLISNQYIIRSLSNYLPINESIIITIRQDPSIHTNYIIPQLYL